MAGTKTKRIMIKNIYKYVIDVDDMGDDYD